MNRELNDMKHFEYYYEKVKPIVLKLRRTYFVKLWDYDDWLQEGRIVLFQLLQDHFYKIIQNYLRQKENFILTLKLSFQIM